MYVHSAHLMELVAGLVKWRLAVVEVSAMSGIHVTERIGSLREKQSSESQHCRLERNGRSY